MSTTFDGLRRPALALLGAWCVLADTSCESHGVCCRYPATVTATVPVTWTVAGQSAVTGCAAVGATQVRAEFHGPEGAEVMAGAPCVSGQATFQARLFEDMGWTHSAGFAILRLLDAASSELTAFKVYLVWDSGKVTAEAPLVLASPGGSIRYRWCLGLSTGGTLRITAQGPMWHEETEAVAGATERTLSALALGQYELSA